MVRLNGDVEKEAAHDELHFNSGMVRLNAKTLSCEPVHAIKFQFRYGSIKCLNSFGTDFNPPEFQFRYGSIK